MTDPPHPIALDTVVDEIIGMLSPVFPKTAREEAYNVIAGSLPVSPSKLRFDRDRMTMTPEQRHEIIEKTIRRTKREPQQYISGHTWFMGESFLVGKGVLIPRSDTEILVEEAIRIAKESIHISSAETFRFFEFCTGSGCIALSFLKKMRDGGYAMKGVATDISGEALAYAEENAQQLDDEGKIGFLEWDLFSDRFPSADETYPMLLANPPYIRTDIMDTLEPEVSMFEPRIALDGGPDGLRFYRRILDCTEDLLAPDGWILLEIGYDQEQEVMELIEKTGSFTQISCTRDYGGNPRVIIAKKRERASNGG